MNNNGGVSTIDFFRGAYVWVLLYIDCKYVPVALKHSTQIQTLQFHH